MSTAAGDGQAGDVEAVAAAVRPPEGEPEHVEATGGLVRVVLEWAAGDGPAPLVACRELGGRYAGTGVSHAGMLHELNRVIIELSRRWWSTAATGDVGRVLRLSQVVESGMPALRAALGDGYCAALAASGTRSTGRRRLAAGLLAGAPAGRRLHEVAHVEQAGHYLLLSVAAREVRVSADEVADRFGCPGVLVHGDADVLDVLVPVGRRALDAQADVTARAFDRLATLTGVTVAGTAVAPVAELAEAAAGARSALRIARACGRRGPVPAEQVLVEQALTGSVQARGRLAELIGSLARWPHLPQTLLALYENDLDRSATADALHIARRTLSKRLDRIHQLTGIRPTSAHGVQTFLSALAVDRMAIAERDVPETGTC
jgi:PucR C-terminal helix-turn-helix domain